MQNQEFTAHECSNCNDDSAETLESFFGHLEQLKQEFDTTSKKLKEEKERGKNLEEEVKSLWQRMHRCYHQTELLTQKKQRIAQQKEMTSMTLSLRKTLQLALIEERDRKLQLNQSLKNEVVEIQNQIINDTQINTDILNVDYIRKHLKENLNNVEMQFENLKRQVNCQQEERKKKELQYKEMKNEKERLEKEIESLRTEEKDLRQQVYQQRQEMKRQEQLRNERKALIKKAHEQRRFTRYNNYNRSTIVSRNSCTSVSSPVNASSVSPPQKVQRTLNNSSNKSPFKFKPLHNNTSQTKQKSPSFKKVSDILAEQKENKTESTFNFDLL